MNQKKRARLRDAMEMLAKVSGIVDSVYDQEQDCVDNCPENLQGTDRYEQMESAAGYLYDAVEKIDEAKECIESAMV